MWTQHDAINALIKSQHTHHTPDNKRHPYVQQRHNDNVEHLAPGCVHNNTNAAVSVIRNVDRRRCVRMRPELHAVGQQFRQRLDHRQQRQRPQRQWQQKHGQHIRRQQSGRCPLLPGARLLHVPGDFRDRAARQRHRLLCGAFDAAHANGHQHFHRQPGRRRHPDDGVLCAVLVRVDSGAGLLAVRHRHVLFGQLLAGRVGAGERLHAGRDQRRSFHGHHVAAAAANHQKVCASVCACMFGCVFVFVTVCLAYVRCAHAADMSGVPCRNVRAVRPMCVDKSCALNITALVQIINAPVNGAMRRFIARQQWSHLARVSANGANAQTVWDNRTITCVFMRYVYCFSGFPQRRNINPCVYINDTPVLLKRWWYASRLYFIPTVFWEWMYNSRFVMVIRENWRFYRISNLIMYSGLIGNIVWIIKTFVAIIQYLLLWNSGSLYKYTFKIFKHKSSHMNVRDQHLFRSWWEFSLYQFLFYSLESLQFYFPTTKFRLFLFSLYL